MKLRHIHLPGLTSYAQAGRLQDLLVSSFLSHKAFPSTHPAPQPTILTAEFEPVYTCGRREVGTVSSEQQAYLRSSGADFYESLRGGQTTYHGPGQLVAYPVLDLRRHSLAPRDYVCLLEKSIIELCRRYGLATMRTGNPGVWVTEDKKLAAVGVHLRRHVSSHGIGLNVSTNLGWFERIVACGLEGKRTTSLEAEGVGAKTVEEVGRDFAGVMAERLKDIQGVEAVGAEVLDR